MTEPSRKRRKRQGKSGGTDGSTAGSRKGASTSSTTRAASPSRTRTKRKSKKAFVPFSPVSSEEKPDGYLYLELLSRDCADVREIEQKLSARTSLAERCYTQSKIPVYRIPEAEASKFDPWPFILDQSVYAGCVLRIDQREKRGFVFRNHLSLKFILNGDFLPLSGTLTRENSQSGGPRRRKSRQNAKSGA